MDTPLVSFFSNRKLFMFFLIFTSLILLMLLFARMYLLTRYSEFVSRNINKQYITSVNESPNIN